MEHGAVLRHDGKPTRIARAIAAAIAETKIIAAVETAQGVQLVFSFQQHWANAHRPAMPTKWDYRARLEQDWYAGAKDIFGEVAVACPVTEDTPRVLLIPLAQMEEPGLIDKIGRCLQSGGTVVSTVDLCRLDMENGVYRRRPLWILQRWVKVPDLEILHLQDGFAVDGRIGAARFKGTIFWALPEGPAMGHVRAIGRLRWKNMSGPVALDFKIGAGRLVVSLAELDRCGVTALIRAAVPKRDIPASDVPATGRKPARAKHVAGTS